MSPSDAELQLDRRSKFKKLISSHGIDNDVFSAQLLTMEYIFKCYKLKTCVKGILCYIT